MIMFVENKKERYINRDSENEDLMIVSYNVYKEFFILGS